MNGLESLLRTISIHTIQLRKDAIRADLRLHLRGYQTEHRDMEFALFIKQDPRPYGQKRRAL